MTQRIGNQTPTFQRVGEYDHSDVDACVTLFAHYGIELMEWQVYQLKLMLARNALNRVACKSICFSVPRQNGKSFACRLYAIVCAMLYSPGRRVIYSCHNGDVCREFYEMLLNLFDNPDEYPDLANEVTNIVKQSGRERFSFRSNGSISFATRTNSKNRGTSADVLIIDEAQELTSSMMAAIRPVMSAGKSKDGQIVYVGTPPDPSCRGTEFKRFHDDAHDETKPSYQWWVEWAYDGEPITKETTAEEKYELAWEYNPGMGGVLNPEEIAQEANEMSFDTYARERLGWWSTTASSMYIFSKEEWEKLTVETPPDTKAPNTIISYGVKIAPDDTEIALCAAIRTIDENKQKRIYVELRDVRSLEHGTDWLVSWLVARKSTTASILIDGKNGATNIYDALRDGGYSVNAVSVATPQDAIDSTALLKTLSRNGKLSHPVSKVLDDSAVTSTKRPIGNSGGYGYDDGNGDSVPLAAAALAAQSAYTTKRNPNRKMKILGH